MNKSIKKIAVFLILALFVGLLSPSAAVTAKKKSYKITLKNGKSAKSLYVGSSYTLRVKGKSVVYSVSNKKKAEVSKKSGKIKPLATGKVTVYAKTKKGKVVAKKKINIKKRKLQLSNGQAAPSSLDLGMTYTLNVKGVKVYYYSSNKKIAAINKRTGKLTTLRAGNVTITVKNKSTKAIVLKKKFVVAAKATAAPSQTSKALESTLPAATALTTATPQSTSPTPTSSVAPTPTEPSSTEPTATEPTSTEPTATEPTSTEPTATEPTSTEPTVTEPSSTEPASTAAPTPTLDASIYTISSGYPSDSGEGIVSNNTMCSSTEGYAFYFCLVDDETGNEVDNYDDYEIESSNDNLYITSTIKEDVKYHYVTLYSRTAGKADINVIRKTSDTTAGSETVKTFPVEMKQYDGVATTLEMEQNTVSLVSSEWSQTSSVITKFHVRDQYGDNMEVPSSDITITSISTPEVETSLVYCEATVGNQISFYTTDLQNAAVGTYKYLISYGTLEEIEFTGVIRQLSETGEVGYCIVQDAVSVDNLVEGSQDMSKTVQVQPYITKGGLCVVGLSSQPTNVMGNTVSAAAKVTNSNKEDVTDKYYSGTNNQFMVSQVISTPDGANKVMRAPADTYHFVFTIKSKDSHGIISEIKKETDLVVEDSSRTKYKQQSNTVSEFIEIEGDSITNAVDIVNQCFSFSINGVAYGANGSKVLGADVETSCSSIASVQFSQITVYIAPDAGVQVPYTFDTTDSRKITVETLESTPKPETKIGQVFYSISDRAQVFAPDGSGVEHSTYVGTWNQNIYLKICEYAESNPEKQTEITSYSSYRIQSENPEVVFVPNNTIDSSTNSVAVLPIKAGAAKISIIDMTTKEVIYTMEITVKPKRVATTISLSEQEVTLHNAPYYENDHEFTAEVLDQYGERMENCTVNARCVEQPTVVSSNFNSLFTSGANSLYTIRGAGQSAGTYKYEFSVEDNYNVPAAKYTVNIKDYNNSGSLCFDLLSDETEYSTNLPGAEEPQRDAISFYPVVKRGDICVQSLAYGDNKVKEPSLDSNITNINVSSIKVVDENNQNVTELYVSDNQINLFKAESEDSYDYYSPNIPAGTYTVSALCTIQYVDTDSYEETISKKIHITNTIEKKVLSKATKIPLTPIVNSQGKLSNIYIILRDSMNVYYDNELFSSYRVLDYETEYMSSSFVSLKTVTLGIYNGSRMIRVTYDVSAIGKILFVD